MTTLLSDPTPELALRLTSGVDPEKNIVGLKMAAMGGSNPSSLDSLAKVAAFIHIDDYQTAMTDRQSTVGYLEPNALALWIEEVLEDTELADAVRAKASEGEFYGAIAMPIKELLLERLAQAEAVLSPEADGSDGEEAQD